MAIFDAEKFMKALDDYVGFRAMAHPTDSSVRREREAEARLLEQLKVLEEVTKTRDRLLHARDKITDLVKTAHEKGKSGRPVAALRCCVDALEVLAKIDTDPPYRLSYELTPTVEPPNKPPN